MKFRTAELSDLPDDDPSLQFLFSKFLIFLTNEFLISIFVTFEFQSIDFRNDTAPIFMALAVKKLKTRCYKQL